MNKTDMTEKDKLHTLAYEQRKSPYMSYIKRLTSEALTRIPYNPLFDNFDENEA